MSQFRAPLQNDAYGDHFHPNGMLVLMIASLLAITICGAAAALLAALGS